MADENRIEGNADPNSGKGEAAAGDAATAAQGNAKDAACAAHQWCGQGIDEIKHFVARKPLAALLSAMGIGVAVGFLLRRRC